MRYLVLVLALFAACDDAVLQPDSTSAPLRSATMVKRWAASAQTQQQYGIVRWRFTQAGNGDVQFAGEKANGHDLFAQWLFQSGSPANPWTILDSGETFAAVRQNGNDQYFAPRTQPWKWDFQEAIMQAFVSDAGLILGRKIVHFAALDVPTAPVSELAGSNCGPAVAQWVSAGPSVGDAFNDMAGSCLFTTITNLRGAKTCAEDIVYALAVAKESMRRFNDVVQYCDDPKPPPPNPPTPPFEDPGPGKPDPGAGVGTDAQGLSWFTWVSGTGVPVCYMAPGDPNFYCF